MPMHVGLDYSEAVVVREESPQGVVWADVGIDEAEDGAFGDFAACRVARDRCDLPDQPCAAAEVPPPCLYP
jgi:hypothetical protein